MESDASNLRQSPSPLALTTAAAIQQGWVRHLTLLSLALFLVSCDRPPVAPETAPEELVKSGAPALLTFQEGHMGTEFTLRVWAGPEELVAAKAAVAEAFARIEALEMVFSDYEVDSEIVRLTTHPPGEAVPISSDLFAMLVKTQTLSEETGGAFDVTVGPMVRLWRQARKNHRLPTAERIAEARERSGWQKLRLDRETPAVILDAKFMQLDFGGIAKGFAADEAMKILKQHGFARSLVAASGDIVVGDPPPDHDAWRIGIRSLDVVMANDPDKPLTGSVPLIQGAISTSGDTQQAVNIDGVRYSHIVDTKTALGLTHRIAVTVIGPDATTTDSYATTVSVLGKERGLAFIESKPGVECLILEADDAGTITETRSSRFPEIARGE
ncbi:MAG: FAD:protein FMN transferase [Verrucomicrobiae bacterium]|nr:FAD:protein FMN transferase [Verrucomicrobiae bacterium]